MLEKIFHLQIDGFCIRSKTEYLCILFTLIIKIWDDFSFLRERLGTMVWNFVAERSCWNGARKVHRDCCQCPGGVPSVLGNTNFILFPLLIQKTAMSLYSF